MPPAAQASSSKLKTKSTDGKKKTESKKTVPDTALDIDSIFSNPVKPKTKSDAVGNGKGKEKAQDGVVSKKPMKEEPGSSGASKKKKKAKKSEGNDNASTVEAEPTRVVEVVDTSIPKVKEVTEPVKGKKRDRKAAEEDEMFADSRGTGPSASSTFTWCQLYLQLT